VKTQNADSTYRFAPGSARRLRKQGTWLRDEAGRYVLLRGVNLGPRAKLPPFLPFYPANRKEARADPRVFESEMARVRPRLQALSRELGINFLRLVITWEGLEPTRSPEPGHLTPEGLEYLSRVRDLIAELSTLGFHVLVDFHQDIASSLFGGDGFPAWAVAVAPGHPLPPQRPEPTAGWALNYYDTWLSPLGQEVRHALRSFWENRLTQGQLQDYPVRDHFIKTFGAAAAFFMNAPAARDGILGYEPFNEPHQVGLDETVFEAKLLPAFYRQAFAALRQSDPDALFFAEPRVDWTTYALEGPEFRVLDHTGEPTTVLGLTDQADEGYVFSFHYYDPWLMEQGVKELWPLKVLAGDSLLTKEPLWTRAFDLMTEAATSRTLIPFLTEFGASQKWEPPEFATALRQSVFGGSQAAAYIGLQFEQVERKCLNSVYWNVDFYNTTENGDDFNLENFSLLGPDWRFRHAEVLARPWPWRSSAEPEQVWFDLESAHAAVVLKGALVTLAEPTVVFVPKDHQYFRGFEARVALEAQSRVAWDAEQRLLYWWPDSKAKAHGLVLCPRGQFNATGLPARVKELLGPGRVALEVA